MFHKSVSGSGKIVEDSQSIMDHHDVALHEGRAFFVNKNFGLLGLNDEVNMYFQVYSGYEIEYWDEIVAIGQAQLEVWPTSSLHNFGTSLNNIVRHGGLPYVTKAVNFYHTNSIASVNSPVNGFDIEWGSGNKIGGVSDSNRQVIGEGNTLIVMTSKSASNNITYTGYFNEIPIIP